MIGNDYLTTHHVNYPADYVEQLKAYNAAAPVSKAAGIPGFWRKKGTWSFRFSSDVPGFMVGRPVFSDGQNADWHGKRGKVTVEEAENE